MLAALQPVAAWAGQAAMQLQRWAAGRLAVAGSSVAPGSAPAAGERAGMQREAHEWLEARRPPTAAQTWDLHTVHARFAKCALTAAACSCVVLIEPTTSLSAVVH